MTPLSLKVTARSIVMIIHTTCESLRVVAIAILYHLRFFCWQELMNIQYNVHENKALSLDFFITLVTVYATF